MEVFRKLGETLEARWRQHDYDAGVFPELAAALLESADQVGKTGTLDILRWIAGEPALPTQQDAPSRFGDLAITFYHTPRFFVSALLWLDGTTAIHQHGFSGAFRVLVGGSLHTRYRFTEQRPVNDHFRLGSLERAGVELLETGSVRRIESGDRSIHSLFHLERPSVTLVVRTHSDPGAKPQWSYCPPGVAFDPFFEDPVTRKQLEAVQVLLGLEAGEADVELREMLASSDLQTAHQVLSAVFHRLATNPLKRALGVAAGERFQQFLDTAREHHGAAIDLFEECFREQARQHEIIDIRRFVTCPDQRFLLALLLNVPDRRAVLELIARRSPDRDPVDEFLDRIEELSTTRELGSPAPNVLGIPDFGTAHLVVLRRLLDGGSLEEAAADLGEVFTAEERVRVRETAARVAASLRDSGPLRAVLREA